MSKIRSYVFLGVVLVGGGHSFSDFLKEGLAKYVWKSWSLILFFTDTFVILLLVIMLFFVSIS